MSAGYMAKCGSKARHPTQTEAEAHRASMIARGMWSVQGSNTYHCNQCGSFHSGRIGSSNRGKGRQARTRPVHHTQ